jgi:hypothetical protein
MSTLPPIELVTILDDMRRTLEARLYYPAVLVALTIPDICMGVMLAERQGLKPKHYV